MKKLLIFAFINLINCGFALSQSFDTACPANTSPLNTMTTRNPVTGNLQANGCIDGNGNLVGTSAVSPTASATLPGETIKEIDTGTVFLRDEFAFHTGVSSGLIGDLNWKIINQGNIKTTTGLDPLHMGEQSIGNNSIQSQMATMSLFSGYPTTNFTWALLDYPGWQVTYVFRIHRGADTTSAQQPAPALLHKAIYIGLANNGNDPQTSGWNRPAICICLRYDTSITAPSINDTTFKFEVVSNPILAGGITRSNTAGTVVDTTVVPAEDAYYRLDIKSTLAGQVSMSLNGGTASTFTIPKITITAGTGCNSVAAANGQAGINFCADSSPGLLPFGVGSQVTIGGLTAGNAVLNGIRTLNADQNTGTTFATILDFPSGATISNNGPAGYTANGYPAYTPIILWGNDDFSTPTANDAILHMDFFGFAWNPGIVTGGPTAGVPIPAGTVKSYTKPISRTLTNSRYFNIVNP